MDSQFQRDPENFEVALIILNIKNNNVKLDSDFGFDMGMLHLWIYACGHGLDQERLAGT